MDSDIRYKTNAVELTYRHTGRFEHGIILSSPERVAQLVHGLSHLTQEIVLFIGLDTYKELVATAELYRGTVDSCSVHLREIFQTALAVPTVAGIVIAHNHPSGHPDPSQEDLAYFDRIDKACELMQIPLIDCVIVGREGAWSRAIGGRLELPESYRQRLQQDDASSRNEDNATAA
jgi:DNA repair protein RadC